MHAALMLSKQQLSVVEVSAAIVIIIEVAPKMITKEKKKLFGFNRVDLKGSSGRKKNLFSADIPLSSACLVSLLHNDHFTKSIIRALLSVGGIPVHYPCHLNDPGSLMGRGGTE